MFCFWDYFRGRTNRLMMAWMGNERGVKSGLTIVPLARVAGRMELPEDRELVQGAVWE